MDPQKLSQLDPKLRNAYQRVMGTTIPQPQSAPVQAQTPPPSAPTTPIPEPEPTPPPTNEPTPTIQETPVPQPQPLTPQPPTPQPSIPTPLAQANNFVQMNSEVPAVPSQNFTVPSPMSQAQSVAIKKKSGMMPILFGIVGLVFIVIYTLFWTKIFNFKLPFLP